MCHISGRELVASHAAPYARHCRCTGFHQDRLRATVLERPLPNLQVKFVEASTEADLAAVSTLRVQSFYVYPKERAFAGERYQQMKQAEELERLRENEDGDYIVMALADANADGLQACPPELLIHGGESALVGTLDVSCTCHADACSLLGDERDSAYMHNVCTADIARRRGVGRALVSAARAQATKLGVGTLYVHLKAVNEIGRRLYESCGFELEKEESSNHAHYRGHCLDGIEGRGRIIVMKLTL